MSETAFGTVRHFALEAPFIRAFNNLNSETFLRVGQVSKINYPSGQNNNPHITYDVWVYSGLGRQLYRNVAKMEMLGSQFNRSGITLQETTTPADIEAQSSADAATMNGSMVLVLCANGYAQQAYIVGCAPHAKDRHGGEEIGQHSWFEFNGLSFTIDKEGAATLLFGGPRDVNGKRINENIGPTSLRINAKGDFSVSDKGNNLLVFDAEKGTFRFSNDNGSLEFEQNGEVTLAAELALSLGKKEATESLILGDSYRAEESKTNKELIDKHISMALNLQELSLQLAVTSAAATASGVAAGLAVGLTAASLAAAQAAIDAGDIAATISNFEARSQSYLSKKVKTE